jgi:hypothetical protein
MRCENSFLIQWRSIWDRQARSLRCGAGGAQLDTGQAQPALGQRPRRLPGRTADLEHVLQKDPNYDFQRAPGLLAHCLAKTGEPAAAERLFQDVLRTSTLTETQYKYAEFLSEQGRKQEAHELANRILAKRGTMPGFLKRRERPIFRKAKMLLGKVPI